MADEDIATKAPESDAQQDTQKAQSAEHISGIEGDTKPDQGSTSLGEHCVTDRPTPAGQTPTGELTKYDDIDVYVTKPADYPHAPSKLLLLLTGGTGVHSTNNQLQADKYAAEGFLVVMPDQFGGDPAPASTRTTHAEDGTTMIEKLKLGIVTGLKNVTTDVWLARQTPEKVLPILHKVITSVKEEYADAVANGGGIYAVGYCFGAKYVLLLGSDLSVEFLAQGQENKAAEEGTVVQNPQIKAGAIAHGTLIHKEDMAGMKMPLSVVAVRDDPYFPEDVLEAGKKALEDKQQEVEVKIYSDVPHGFAVLGDYEDAKIVQAQGQAFEQMLGWLKAH